MRPRIVDARMVLALSALVAASACEDNFDEGPGIPPPPPTTVNQPPVLGRPPTATIAPNTEATLDLLAGTSDPDGDPLTVSQVFPDSPSTGILLLSDHRTVEVTPPHSFVGTIHLSYFVDDQHGHFVQATASVLVDTPPLAIFTQLTVVENTPSAVVLQSNDPMATC